MIGRSCTKCRKSFLLTPLREGRPAAEIPAYAPACISTHAPAGGATGQKGQRAFDPAISTHAPAGGATDVLPAKWDGDTVFLLTPLREGRQGDKSRWQVFSIYFYSRPCGRGD